MIKIYQGKNTLAYADVNVIIDVLRAFTVSDYAFQQGVDSIILTSNKKEALQLSDENTYLSGEESGGYKIPQFDFGNSPYALSKAKLQNKRLVQKTTNGVAVTLESLNAQHIFVTGFSNAKSTAEYISRLKQCKNINIIASHPQGDEDLACAEYIKAILLNNYENLQKLEESTVYRILNSEAAQKFHDINNKDFSILDLTLCSIATKNEFIMKVKQKNSQITIEKEML